MTSLMTLNRIFVYGTLCVGYAGHHLVATALAAPPVEAELPHHRLYNAGHYPLLHKAGPGHTVKGQLLTLDPQQCDAVLARLDDYEDAHGPNPMYHRVHVLVDVIAVPPLQTRAWAYILNPAYWDLSTLPEIPHGDWRKSM